LQSERDFVSAFLSKQLPHQSADEFMHIFLSEAGPLQEKEETRQPNLHQSGIQ
jgi:hypothetical protein